MPSIYIKEKGKDLYTIQLKENEYLLLLSNKTLRSILNGDTLPIDELPNNTYYGIRSIGGIMKDFSESTYGFKIEYNKDVEEVRVEPVPVPQIPLKGYMLVTEGLMRWSEEDAPQLINKDGRVAEIHDEARIARIGVGAEAKQIVEAVDKVKVVVEFSVIHNNKELGTRRVSFEAGKTYFLGTPTEDMLEKNKDLQPHGVYLLDEEGNIFVFLGYSGGESSAHLILHVSDDGKLVLEDYNKESETTDKPREIKENTEIILGDLLLKVREVKTLTIEDSSQSRFDMIFDENQIVESPSANIIKEELTEEAKAVFNGVLSSVSGLVEQEKPENISKVLDEVESIGAEIEREVIESLLPVATEIELAMKPRESNTWFRLLRTVNEVINSNSHVPEVDEVKRALEYLKPTLKETIIEHIKTAKFYVKGEEKEALDLLNLSETDVEKLAENLAEKLIQDNGFMEIIRGGVSHIRYGISRLPEKREIYSSYKHAIRLNGYVTSTLLEELSEKIVVNKEFVKSFKEKLVEKSQTDIKNIPRVDVRVIDKPDVAVQEEKKSKKVEEEELVSA